MGDCPYKHMKSEVVYRGKWASMKTVKFTHAGNKEGLWECAFRNDDANKIVDGVDVIGTLISAKNKTRHFVLVKQYRIPIGGWSLEFPAGLTEPNETVEQCAIRELNEETGYMAKVGDISHVSKGFQYLDPGLSNDSINYVKLTIDADVEQNVNPIQSLDEGETCEVVLVACDSILAELDKLTQEGIHVQAIVYSFAIGYAMSQS